MLPKTLPRMSSYLKKYTTHYGCQPNIARYILFDECKQNVLMIKQRFDKLKRYKCITYSKYNNPNTNAGSAGTSFENFNTPQLDE